MGCDCINFYHNLSISFSNLQPKKSTKSSDVYRTMTYISRMIEQGKIFTCHVYHGF